MKRVGSSGSDLYTSGRQSGTVHAHQCYCSSQPYRRWTGSACAAGTDSCETTPAISSKRCRNSGKRPALTPTLSQHCHKRVRIRGIGGGRIETVSAGQNASRAIARQKNSPHVRLGVKWSQVQFLSPLPVSPLPVPATCQPDPVSPTLSARPCQPAVSARPRKLCLTCSNETCRGLIIRPFRRPGDHIHSPRAGVAGGPTEFDAPVRPGRASGPSLEIVAALDDSGACLPHRARRHRASRRREPGFRDGSDPIDPYGDLTSVRRSHRQPDPRHPAPAGLIDVATPTPTPRQNKPLPRRFATTT